MNLYDLNFDNVLSCYKRKFQYFYAIAESKREYKVSCRIINQTGIQAFSKYPILHNINYSSNMDVNNCRSAINKFDFIKYCIIFLILYSSLNKGNFNKYI